MNHFKPQSSQEALALEIAKAFGDEENLKAYISLCNTYPTAMIWKAYGVVKETPLSKIRKSRGALFTYLVKRYGEKKINPEDISH